MQLKEILWVAFGRFAQFALLLLTLRIATTYLPPTEMGKVSIVTATVAFFALFMINPVGMFMNRRLHAWNTTGQVRAYLSYFWTYIGLVGLIATTTLIVLTVSGVLDTGVDIYWLLFLVCGNLIFGTVNQTVIPSLNMLGYCGWFTVLTLITVATSLLLASGVVHMVSPKAEYWPGGLLMGQVLVGLVGKSVFFSKLKTPLEYSPVSGLSYSKLIGLWKFAWPVAVAVGLGWIQNQGYRYLMEGHLGLGELGLFVAGFGISSGLISGFESIFVTYFQPRFYGRISNGNSNEHALAWIEYSKAILPALFLTTIFIVATAPELTNLLLGDSYRKSMQFIVWGAIAELARISTAVFGMLAHARMNTKILLLPNMLGALAAVLLVVFLTPIYGSNGVGLGLTFSSLISLMVTLYISWKYFSVMLSPRIFVKSLIMGGVILSLSEILRLFAGFNEEHWVALIKLCLLGTLFAIFQYIMIMPLLATEAARLRN